MGGMNYLHHDFVQVSKLSKDQKKGLSKKWNTFFPRIQVDTHTQMHTRVKLLRGMHTKTLLKLLGGIQSNYWGIYPPGFWHPWLCIYYCCIRIKIMITYELWSSSKGIIMYKRKENVNALWHHTRTRWSRLLLLDIKSAATCKQNLVMIYDG